MGETCKIIKTRKRAKKEQRRETGKWNERVGQTKVKPDQKAVSQIMDYVMCKQNLTQCFEMVKPKKQDNQFFTVQLETHREVKNQTQ